MPAAASPTDFFNVAPQLSMKKQFKTIVFLTDGNPSRAAAIAK
jgi:hypothetical protein